MRVEKVTYQAVRDEDIERLKIFKKICKAKRISMSSFFREIIRGYVESHQGEIVKSL